MDHDLEELVMDRNTRRGFSMVGAVPLALEEDTEKVDLENTVVDESQRQLKEVGSSSRSRQDKYSESASKSKDENERVDAAHEDTNEEDKYIL
ncbi:oxysterol-binding protein-related protein 1C-like [Primulina tabacum]|uniref:oxysterol-binding protein-related protein 1C-like n=1 Tax=Primulina tabacum TaxID=48773 RepID=UPI003F598EB7